MESSPTVELPAQPKGPFWALALSGLFHPLLITTYMYVLLVLINPYLFGSSSFFSQATSLVLIKIFLYTFVIPMVSVLIMIALDMISNVMIEDRMQRVGPLLLVMVLYFWVTYNLIKSNDVPQIFSAFMLGVAGALALAFVINVVDKISLHATGMGGMVGMILICLAVFGGRGMQLGGITLSLGVVLIGIILLAGLVGSARLALAAHDKQQVYMGYMVGFIPQILAYIFYFR